ncbi:MAG TPA: UbiA family prenyltransferase [Gemmatimonadaceae bacterium]|nr:UbiA family prenyltransferase [Gemmatimonadaceae bacterium]
MLRSSIHAAAHTRPGPRVARRIWVDLLLYPTHTFPTAAAPILVAVGLAVHDRVAAPVAAMLAFVASWAIHVGGVFADNYALITEHRDIPEHPELLSALKDGSLTLRGLRFAIAACFALALLTAPLLAASVGWPAVIVLGVIGALASLGYGGGPLPYAKLGVADPVFFAMFGLIAVPATYIAQAGIADQRPLTALLDAFGSLSPNVYVAALPVAALVTNVLLIDEIRDADFDRAKDWRSGAVRWGRGFSRVELWTLTMFAYLIPFWLWLGGGYRISALLPLATLPTAIDVARRVRCARQFEELFPLTPRASRLAMVYGLLSGIGLAIR